MSYDLTPVRALGLLDDEMVTLRKLLTVWQSKRRKNALISTYYDGHRAFRDLGISIPPQLKNSRAALGWPSKAVGAAATKHAFEEFTLNGESDPFEISELLVRNDWESELPQIFTAAYKHGVSFITVSSGDTALGEPEVMIQARDAEWTTALWDKRRREISAALAITDTDDAGDPSEATMFLRDKTVFMDKKWGVWKAKFLPNPTGRVMVEAIRHDPELNRPFGHSRITREVRYLTDVALRTLVRTESGAEFFASPQRYALGASEEAFKHKDRWVALNSRVLALELNEEGRKPEVGQFPQMSMDPHLSMYRQLAQNFASATDLPTSTVGIFADNPQSAEAMQAAEARLSDLADKQWRISTGPLRRIAQDIVMVRDKLTEPPAESWKIGVKYTPPKYVSPQAQSDYISKVTAAIPDLASTTVALRKAGLTAEEILEVQAEWKKSAGPSVLAQIEAATAGGTGSTSQPAPTPVDDLRARFEALKAARDAGIDPQSAADLIGGLDGITFTQLGGAA